MTRSKATAIALFVSLGLNVFLLGIFSARLLGAPHHPPPHRMQAPHHADQHHAAQDHSGPHHVQAENSSDAKHSATGARPPKPSKRDREESGTDPRDMRMLRQMIQVMGGRKDPRVREFWKKTQEDTRATRNSLREARDQVQKKVIATPFVKADLEQALADLSKQTSASQSHAQAALIELATLLSDEERARLQEDPSPERHGERK